MAKKTAAKKKAPAKKKAAAKKTPAKKTASKKKATSTKERKPRKLKYWLIPVMDNDELSRREKKRKDAFALWKTDKEKYGKPVKVLIEYANPLALVDMCLSDKFEELEDAAVEAADTDDE